MTHPTRIAICGRSLLLTLVADSLAGRPGLEVAYVAPRQLDALAQLAGCDLVIMEHAEDCETDHLILSLLQFAARPADHRRGRRPQRADRARQPPAARIQHG